MKHGYSLITTFFTSLLIVACSSKEASITADQAVIDYDLLDTRIESPAGIRRQVAQYMETVMRAAPLAPPRGRKEAGHGGLLRRL